MKNSIGFTFFLLLLLMQPTAAQTLRLDRVKIHSPAPDNCGALELADSHWQERQLYDIKNTGDICLRARVKLTPTHGLDERPALIVSMLAASAIYWDGELIARNGLVADNARQEQPGRIKSVHLLPDNATDGKTHLLAIRATSHHLRGNFFSTFYALNIVDYKTAIQSNWIAAMPAIFFMGALTLMALLFQGVYWFYQRLVPYQLFSLLSASAALLLLAEVWRPLFGYLYDLHLLRLLIIMCLTLCVGLLLVAFYGVLYQLKRTWVLLGVTGAAFGLAVVFTPGYDGKSAVIFALALNIALLLNIAMLIRQKPLAWAHTGALAVSLILLFATPNAFLQNQFAIIIFLLLLVTGGALLREIRSHRYRALQASQLEIQLLKHNFQPHFLMNSLMLIIEWIEQQPAKAATFTQSLAQLLRRYIKVSGQYKIELDEELALCREYLATMESRFDAHYSLEVNGSTQNLRIPPAIIHTLLENAFTHSRIDSGATFKLKITTTRNTVELNIDTPGHSKGQQDGSGFGERYIRGQLTHCYNGDYRYSHYQDKNRWITHISFSADTP